MLVPVQEIQGCSVDCLAFSQDGRFLAAGGQDGQVKIWQFQSGEIQLISTLDNQSVWVDQMAWSPTRNHLAFSLGRYVQVWDALAGTLETSLGFADSSVLGIAWHPQGQYLGLCGYQGVKIWQTSDWFEDPEILEVPSASLAIAWSMDGQYIASGNLNRTLLVWEWGSSYPWRMQGFPGKVRQLTWSDSVTKSGTPLLATCSGDSIVVIWEKASDPAIGWRSTILNHHRDSVEAIAFQPHNLLLASAARDGRICLWHRAKRVGQILEGAINGCSCLAWHPQGHQLVTGGESGELLIWLQEMRGQGFAE